MIFKSLPCRLSVILLTVCAGLFLDGCGGSGGNSGAPSSLPQQTIYVGQQGVGILIYSTTDGEGAVPAGTIQSSDGMIPRIFAVDPTGAIYTTGQPSNSIEVFAPGTKYTAAPTRVIKGSATGFGISSSGPTQIVVGRDGQIYTHLTYSPLTPGSSEAIAVYPSGASGNMAPSRLIYGRNTQFPDSIAGIAVDSESNLYLFGPQGYDNTPTVTVYPPMANGNVAPIRTIAGNATQMAGYSTGMMIDTSDNLYTCTSSDTYHLSVFSKGASGNVAPVRVLSGPLGNPVDCSDMALDSAGNLYTLRAVPSFGTYVPPAINKYAAGASGTVTPFAKITSSRWSMPTSGIVIH